MGKVVSITAQRTVAEGRPKLLLGVHHRGLRRHGAPQRRTNHSLALTIMRPSVRLRAAIRPPTQATVHGQDLLIFPR